MNNLNSLIGYKLKREKENNLKQETAKKPRTSRMFLRVPCSVENKLLVRSVFWLLFFPIVTSPSYKESNKNKPTVL